MTIEICTMFTDFILLGLSAKWDVQQGLFVLFLLVYGITVIANLGMILLISMDPRLHTPIYYFLRNLSFCVVCYSSSVSPKMLADFLFQQKNIAYDLCVVQMFFYGAFADVDCIMLSVMAYEHYVAICNLLLYTVTMSRRVCIKLVATVYTIAFMDVTIFTCCIIQFSFCDSNIVNYFFCDVPPLLALSTSDTTKVVISVTVSSSFVVGSSIITVLLSYSYIITTILRMKSVAGRCEAFSTCASHLTTVAIFYGTVLFMYFRPSSSYSIDTDKVASLFYAVVIPMLNPLIDSLRNKDVKGALKKAVGTKLCTG